MLTFSKLTFSKISSRNYQSVKQFGSRLGPAESDLLSVLIWVQNVCKGYQQMTEVTDSMERVNNVNEYFRD